MRVAGYVLALGLMTAVSARGQASAGAPAGATGICKDGTYSTAASKDGACRGHKGVQTWYASQAPAMPAPTKGTSATVPAPTPATGPVKSMPAPAPAGNVPVVGQGDSSAKAKSGPAAAAAAKSAAPGGGPGLVWVNTSSNVYHCYGTDFYGKTNQGKYMTEADAKAAGAHGARGQGCSK